MRLAIAAFTALFLVSIAITIEPSDKLPVPDETAQKQASKLIGDVFKAQYESARTPEQKIELAKQLLQVGVDTKDDSIGRFVLFRIARDIAAEAGNMETALAAIEHMERDYDVIAIGLKSQAISRAATALKTPKDHQALFPHFEAIVSEAIAQDRYDVAKTISTTAIASARQSRDAEAVKQAVATAKRVEELEVEFGKVKEAKSILEKEPTNADANLTVGKFYCFVKGDWENGLLMLALSNSEPFKSLATAEIENNKPDPVVLGDGWWTVAESFQGQEADNIKAHAAEWYRQATGLTGLTKIKVEQRLSEFSIAWDAVVKPNQPKKVAQLRRKHAPDAVEIDGHYYKVFWLAVSWSDAAMACEEMGGYLVVLETPEEQKKIAELKGSGKVVWVGGRRIDGVYRWMNGDEIAANRFQGGIDRNLDFVAFNIGSELNTRKADGTFADNSRIGQGVRKIQGFICEWDE